MVIDVVTAPSIDSLEERQHVLHGVDRHAAASDLTERQRRVGVVAHERRHVEGHRQARLALVEQESIPLVGVLALPKPANCRIVQTLSRYMVRCTPRAYGKDPGSPRSRSASIAEFSGPYQAARGRPPRVSGGIGGAVRGSGESDEPCGTPALSIVWVIAPWITWCAR